MHSPTPLRPFLVLLAIVSSLLLGFGARDAEAQAADPAARGLDVYLHLAPSAAPGDVLEITAKAYGFPSVTHAVALAGATLEIGWDPEELDGDPPPPTVHATTDAEGRTRAAIEVPRGPARDLQLLVAVRHGGHTRTRSFKIARQETASIELHTADHRVVPTSTISAWVRVVGTRGEPVAGARVTVSLLEGGVARHSENLVSDRGGLVMARVPIPRIDEPVWQWTLRATADVEGAGAAEVTLVPREETPGTPVLAATWEEPAAGVLAGERVHFKVRVRDATAQPVVDHEIRYWIGLKGTTPPTDDKDWERLGTRARTDGAGEVIGTRDAPTLVKSTGTMLVLVARAILQGHALDAKSQVVVGAPNANATLKPEVPAIVPGLSQRMMLTVTDGHGEGIPGAFTVTADGLSANVTTDTRGEAEITWLAPVGVGASRNVGPCAGGVAAAVVIRPTRAIAVLRSQQEPFTLCVPIDRDAAGIVRVSQDVARPGDKLRVTVVSARGARAASHSVVIRSRDHAQAAAAWLDARADGTASGEIEIPRDGAPGAWDVSVALPDGAREARVLSKELLVVPTVLPMITARRIGGRATPGGTVDFEAQLTDGHGRGLQGAVSAVVIDAFGGGSANVSALDTRARLCSSLGEAATGDRCAAVLERDPTTDALRRALLGQRGGRRAGIKPANDPGAHASKELEKSFSAVLHSLEGAVFEATKQPQALIDARRKEGGRWIMNPELLTLVTDAMNEPPMTPGGEKLVLSDLVAVDPQVTFDNVARRVTRLKIFTVLAAVRDVRMKRGLDPEEPLFKDPNALLRRLVREGALTDDQLLDPWGGTIQYVRSNAKPPAPFLGTIHGFELHAPGPDGVVGTGDDVRDPFERVVRSGTPYARAMQEDKIVDAKWDMVVSDTTVAAWQQLFEELTGRELGFGAGGLGLSGVGEGGGGRGEGIGLGSIGTLGHGRGTAGVSNGDAYWTAPIRTDAEGRVRLSIPLSGAETTWRVAFVGVPDGQGPASTTADVASDLPVSLRVDGGARWVEGDVLDTHVLVRNRTAAALRVTVDASAEGAAVLLDAPRAPRTVDVPARGARTVTVKVRATRAGEGTLVLVAHAPNLPDDTLRHSWEISPPGEPRALTQTAWVNGERDLGIVLDHGYRLAGEPRLVLERGYDDAVAAALESLEPERQKSPHSLVDALEAGLRVSRWAITKDKPRHRALVAIAQSSADRALGRFNTISKAGGTEATGVSAPSMWALRARASLLTRQPLPAAEQSASKERGEICPPDHADVRAAASSSRSRADDEEVLDLEPAPSAAVPPCWGAYVSTATRALANEGDPERIATALVALADRPHRAAIATNLADRLRGIVKLDASGEIDLRSTPSGASRSARTSGHQGDRARRATIYAALLRAQRFGKKIAGEDVLFGQLAALRDVNGGYGSSGATVAVLRALLSSQLEGRGTTRVHVHVDKGSSGQGAIDRDVDVPESGFVVVNLPAGTLDVAVRTTGPALVARLERPVLRLWTRPPPPQESPVGLEVEWPKDPAAGTTGTLRLHVRHSLEGTVDVDARVPLPPGVTLGAPMHGTLQIQGVLAVREPVDHSGKVIEIPVRFGLGGKVTVPEATARIARSSSAAATAPARALAIR